MTQPDTVGATLGVNNEETYNHRLSTSGGSTSGGSRRSGAGSRAGRGRDRKSSAAPSSRHGSNHDQDDQNDTDAYAKIDGERNYLTSSSSIGMSKWPHARELFETSKHQLLVPTCI